jgi:hypothetical protein
MSIILPFTFTSIFFEKVSVPQVYREAPLRMVQEEAYYLLNAVNMSKESIRQEVTKICLDSCYSNYDDYLTPKDKTCESILNNYLEYCPINGRKKFLKYHVLILDQFVNTGLYCKRIFIHG